MADNDSTSGLGWFLAGLGMGALIGVLYAPKSGKETRDDIIASALDARDRANQLYNEGRDQAAQYVEKGKQAAADYVDKGKQAAAEYATKGREVYEQGRTQLSQYVDKGKELVQTHAEAVNAAVEAGKEAYLEKVAEPAEVA